jgi:hypothetical protein
MCNINRNIYIYVGNRTYSLMYVLCEITWKVVDSFRKFLNDSRGRKHVFLRASRWKGSREFLEEQ